MQQLILTKQGLAIFIASQVTQMGTFRFDVAENYEAMASGQLNLASHSDAVMNASIANAAVHKHDVSTNRAPNTWAMVDANAFGHKYLTGFTMVMTKMGAMSWEKPKKGRKWGRLQTADGVWYTGPATPVTRTDVVAKSSKTQEPAKYFAYVRFSTTTKNETIANDIYKLGGFVYFADQARVEKGNPMTNMNILYKAEAGTMRFKQGCDDFWQFEISKGRFFNFPPDASKVLTEALNTNQMEVTLGVRRLLTYQWFKDGAEKDYMTNVVLAGKGAPHDDDHFVCTLKTSTCSVSEHGQRVVAIRRAPYPDGPLPGFGLPFQSPLTEKDGKSMWWPVTAPDLLNAGAMYYTWVPPDGSLGDGGFMYLVRTGAEAYHYRYFEMLSTLCQLKLEAGDVNTPYDQWIKAYPSAPNYATQVSQVQKVKKKRTLVFVIDMQNDFVGMSFQMPCQPKRDALTQTLTGFLDKTFKKGADIIASLDYHPQSHCGLTGDCANTEGPFMEYTDGMKDDRSYYAAADTGRYLNRFPAHCEWRVGSNGRSVPTEGAKFYSTIKRKLHELAVKDPHRVHTVFKGFEKTKDSFSALPTGNEVGTGGYAVSGVKPNGTGESTKGYTPWPKECYGEEVTAHDHDWCFPTKAQLDNPSEGNSMWSVESVIRQLQKTEKGKFERVIVTGLVFDFCVKETAFNAKTLFGPDVEVIVPIELARPACEGSPVPAVAYPPAGLGTAGVQEDGSMGLLERTVQEYEARQIRLVRMEDV